MSTQTHARMADSLFRGAQVASSRPGFTAHAWVASGRSLVDLPAFLDCDDVTAWRVALTFAPVGTHDLDVAYWLIRMRERFAIDEQRLRELVRAITTREPTITEPVDV